MRILRNILAVALLAAVLLGAGLWMAPHKVIGLFQYLATEKLLKHMESAEFSTGEVHLDRYYDSMQPLQSVRLDNESFHPWLRALPKSGNVPLTLSKCWIPHHRIRIVHGTTESRLEICFTCNEFWTEYSGRRKIPLEWREPFRELFRLQGISDKAPTWEETKVKHDVEEYEENGTSQDSPGDPSEK